MRKLLVTLLAAGLCLTGVHAQETENTDGTVTNTDTNEIKTVTADTYQPIGEMEGAENAAMGDGTPQQPQTQYRSRSANCPLDCTCLGNERNNENLYIYKEWTKRCC